MLLLQQSRCAGILARKLPNVVSGRSQQSTLKAIPSPPPLKMLDLRQAIGHLRPMQSAVLEFPYVKELPKREKTKVTKLWDIVLQMRAVYDTDGVLLPPHLVINILGCSKQRVYELMSLERLKRVDVNGHPFVTEKSLKVFASSERKAGRPCMEAESVGVMYRRAKADSRKK